MSVAKKETHHTLNLTNLDNPSNYILKAEWGSLTPEEGKLYQYIIKNTLLSFMGPANEHFARLYDHYLKLERTLTTLERKVRPPEVFKQQPTQLLTQELGEQLSMIKTRIDNLEAIIQNHIQMLIENAILNLQLFLSERRMNKVKQKEFFKIMDFHQSLSISENLETLNEEIRSLKDSIYSQERMIRQNSYLIYDTTSRITSILQTILLMIAEKENLLDPLLKIETEVFELRNKVKDSTARKISHKDIYYLAQQLKDKEEKMKDLAKEISMITLTPLQIVEKLEKQNDVIQFQTNKVQVMRMKLQSKKIEFIVSTLNTDKLNNKIRIVQEKMGELLNKSSSSDLLSSSSSNVSSDKTLLINKINLFVKKCSLSFLKNQELLRNKELSQKIMQLEERLDKIQHVIYDSETIIHDKYQPKFEEKIHGVFEAQLKNIKSFAKEPSVFNIFSPDIELSPSIQKEINKDREELIKAVEECKYDFENMINMTEQGNFASENGASIVRINHIYKKNLKSIMNLILVNELSAANKALDVLMESFEILQKSFQAENPIVNQTNIDINNIEQEV